MWHLSPSGVAREEERPGFGNGWSRLKRLVSVWQQQSANTEQQVRTLEHARCFHFDILHHPSVAAYNPNLKDANKQCRWTHLYLTHRHKKQFITQQ